MRYGALDRRNAFKDYSFHCELYKIRINLTNGTAIASEQKCLMSYSKARLDRERCQA